MHFVTIEGFMIPLNVRDHTLHVHRAMKTGMDKKLFYSSNMIFPTLQCLPHLELDFS